MGGGGASHNPFDIFESFFGGGGNPFAGALPWTCVVEGVSFLSPFWFRTRTAQFVILGLLILKVKAGRNGCF
jgi:hypothetical protein